jgi:hypothetical protein
MQQGGSWSALAEREISKLAGVDLKGPEQVTMGLTLYVNLILVDVETVVGPT